jgi:methyl-accepting chemotaxis protein PixJ
MNTIDRNDTEQQTTAPKPQILDLTSEDSFLSVAENHVSFTELRTATPIVNVDRAGSDRNGQRKTIYQKILLTILPLMLLPFGAIGWMVFSHSSEREPTTDRQSSMRPTQADLWLQDVVYLLIFGGINLGVALWVARRMSTSFAQITTKLNEAANGNLLTQLEAGDTVEFQAVADNFNQLVANFNYTLQQQQLAADANKLFGKIALVAQESLDLRQVYNLGTIGINQLLKTDRVSVYRCDPNGMGILVAESVRDGSGTTASCQVGDIYFAESPAELARYHGGESITFDDLRQFTLSPRRQEFVTQLKLKSMMFVPIIAGKKLVGLISVQQCSRVRTWTTSEVDFCTQAAQRMGLAVEQIATWTTQAAELRRTSLLSRATQLHQSEELTDLLESAMETIRQEFNLDRAMIFSFTGQQSGQLTSCVTKSGSVPIDPAAMTDYLLTRLQLEEEDPDQISSIYHISPTGGLRADEIARLNQLQVAASLVVPIVFEGRLLGWAIGQMCESAREWQQPEIDKFTTVAEQIGLALDWGKSIAQQEVSNRHKDLVAKISLQLRQSLDQDQIIDTALAAIRQALGLDRTIFYPLNAQGQGRIIAESLSFEVGSISILGEVIDAAAMQDTSQAAENRQIASIEDIYQAGLTAPQMKMMEHLQIRSSITIPIVVEDRVFGSIGGQMCQVPHNWQPAEIDLLSQIANQIGLVLSQAQLIEQRENNARQLQSLSNFTLQLRQSLKREDILSTAVELIRQTLDLDRAIVLELDRDFNGKIVAESVVSPDLAMIGKQIEDCCIKDAGYEQGKITALSDIYQAGLSDCHIQMLKRFSIRANLVVPITIDGQLFGLLIGHQCQAPRDWKADEIGLFNQFATQLALAINQSLLIEQRETSAKQAQLLSDITIKLRQSLDQQEILNIALPEIRQVFGFDRVSILVMSGEGEGKIIAESIRSPELSAIGTVFSSEHLAEINELGFDQGKVTVVRDAHQSELSTSLAEFLLQIKLRSGVSTPILIGSQLFGLITGSMSQTSRIWDRSETDMLLQLAAQIGTAINQAQLVSKLEETSRQQSEYAIGQQAAKESLQTNAWELLMQIDRISQGDLTIRASVTADEIGTIADSYNATVESLRSLVMGVQKVSQEVVSSTSRNEISVAELSVEALQQSQDVSIALDRLRDMSGSIQQVVNNALIAESAVMESAQLVQAGDAAMNRTVEGILTIRNTVAETAKKVKRLGESSQKISKVVNLISNFAAQTNLLALNASIEAARAGEEGRGFAVVAEEVRSLARQSAEATGEIEKLVASIQAETNDVVTAMEAGTEQVAIGSRLVDETRSSLNQITATSSKIGALVESIAQSALLQAEDSTKVTQSIDRVASIATKTSVRADNVQASFQDLLKLARELQTNIGQFKID